MLGSIEVFKFEVRPLAYITQRGGLEKELHITVQVNGQQFHTQRVIPNQPANQTEIEYYTDRAVAMLHGILEDYENDIARKQQDEFTAKVERTKYIADNLKPSDTEPSNGK